MNYLEFTVKIVKEDLKLTKLQMKFAYVFCFQGMKMKPIEAAELALELDELK